MNEPVKLAVRQASKQYRTKIEKLRAAISWIEPPFIDENTSEAELRKRISFCVEDAKKAMKGPTP